MGLGAKLNWSQTTRDGTPRSALAKFIDPVGVCIEPAALDPFVVPVVSAQQSDASDESASAPPAATRMDRAAETRQPRQL